MATSLTTFLMFQDGNAEVAMGFYTGLFADGEILEVERYGADGPGPAGTVERARFRIAGQTLMAIDSPIRHGFDFTPSVSLFVQCENDEEIERLFAALAEDGVVLMPLGDYGFAAKFGWCNDRFGVSWQLTL